jgi:branched-chain amino acid transport system substrate-binding protein
VPALIAAIALATAACTHGAGEKDKSATQERRPSGDPVAIGLTNLEGSPAGSVVALREGTEAAVKYINAELDGLKGRPIKLDVCITSGSPESSTACANQMVEHRVVAVLGGVDLGSAASLPILTAAGIPYIGMAPLLPADFTTNGAFTLDPGGLGTAASAVYAVDKLKAEKVAVLHDDSAQGRQLAEAFVRPALLKRGLSAANVKLVAEKADAADMAPAVAAATQAKPDAVIVVFTTPACSRVMQAASALGVDSSMFYIGRCSDPAVVAAGGAGAEGAYFFWTVLHVEANADDPDVKLYATKVKKYGGPDIEAASFDTSRGFATTMSFYRRIATLEATGITPSAVTDKFRTAVDVPAFMGHPYTCDGHQAIPGFVGVCNSNVRIYQYVKGHYRDASGGWISAGAALAG